MLLVAKTYADFKAIAQTFRKLDAVFYNDSVTYNGNTVGFAIACDYQSGTSVELIENNGITFSTTDFPSAIQLSAIALTLANSVFTSGTSVELY